MDRMFSERWRVSYLFGVWMAALAPVLFTLGCSEPVHIDPIPAVSPPAKHITAVGDGALTPAPGDYRYRLTADFVTCTDEVLRTCTADAPEPDHWTYGDLEAFFLHEMLLSRENRGQVPSTLYCNGSRVECSYWTDRLLRQSPEVDYGDVDMTVSIQATLTADQQTCIVNVESAEQSRFVIHGTLTARLGRNETLLVRSRTPLPDGKPLCLLITPRFIAMPDSP